MSLLNTISGRDCLRGWRRCSLMLFPVYSPRSMGYCKNKNNNKKDVCVCVYRERE